MLAVSKLRGKSTYSTFVSLTAIICSKHAERAAVAMGGGIFTIHYSRGFKCKDMKSQGNYVQDWTLYLRGFSASCDHLPAPEVGCVRRSRVNARDKYEGFYDD